MFASRYRDKLKRLFTQQDRRVSNPVGVSPSRKRDFVRTSPHTFNAAKLVRLNASLDAGQTGQATVMGGRVATLTAKGETINVANPFGDDLDANTVVLAHWTEFVNDDEPQGGLWVVCPCGTSVVNQPTVPCAACTQGVLPKFITTQFSGVWSGSGGTSGNAVCWQQFVDDVLLGLNLNWEAIDGSDPCSYSLRDLAEDLPTYGISCGGFPYDIQYGSPNTFVTLDDTANLWRVQLHVIGPSVNMTVGGTKGAGGIPTDCSGNVDVRMGQVTPDATNGGVENGPGGLPDSWCQIQLG